MKKAIILAIAGALATPSAFAAEDTSGMLYTSASEGFYASIRAAYNSGENDGDTARISNPAGPSRFGVRGSNDLGGGLEGFYQYEAALAVENGGDLSTRLGHVGLRGAFGEVVLGSIWANAYNWVYAPTDIGNVGGGNFAYTDLRPGRDSNVAQYTSPDMNGFQGSFLIQMVDNSAPAGSTLSGPHADNGCNDSDGKPVGSELFLDVDVAGVPTQTLVGCVATTAAVVDDNDLDKWIVSARYAFGGVTAAGTYANQPDALTTDNGTDDATAWAFRLGYGQDNWSVNGWYGMENNGDGATNADGDAPADAKTFSLSGVMSVDKTTFYAVWEQQDNVGGTSGDEDSFAVFGVQYNLGVNSHVWANYIAQDRDSTPAADDYVSIGLQHNF